MTPCFLKLTGRAGIAAVLLSFLAPVVIAQSDADLLKTNWIELVKGYKDADSGVEVREVVKDGKTGGMQLHIAVPKVRIGEGMTMEEVRVVGQRPEAVDIKQWLPQFDYEWVDDYDNNHYGLLVRFSEEQKTPLRLFFSSNSGFLQQ